MTEKWLNSNGRLFPKIELQIPPWDELDFHHMLRQAWLLVNQQQVLCLLKGGLLGLSIEFVNSQPPSISYRPALIKAILVAYPPVRHH
jgi:hypothetical protein